MPCSWPSRRKTSSMSYSFAPVLGSIENVCTSASTMPPLMYLSEFRTDCQRRYLAEVLYTSSQSPTSSVSSKSATSSNLSRQICSSSSVSLVMAVSVSGRPSKPHGRVSTSSRFWIMACNSLFTIAGARNLGATSASAPTSAISSSGAGARSSSSSSSSSSYSKRSSTLPIRSLNVRTSMFPSFEGSSAHISFSSVLVTSSCTSMALMSEISRSASKDSMF
mmetsp:Transcript_43740/g.130640  ORF Transcript_43740/g.130640 Transcript_43740/m.130640 type:complete len:221 (-) Transcript_43740:268-930(-)